MADNLRSNDLESTTAAGVSQSEAVRPGTPAWRRAGPRAGASNRYTLLAWCVQELVLEMPEDEWWDLWRTIGRIIHTGLRAGLGEQPAWRPLTVDEAMGRG